MFIHTSRRYLSISTQQAPRRSHTSYQILHSSLSLSGPSHVTGFDFLFRGKPPTPPARIYISNHSKRACQRIATMAILEIASFNARSALVAASAGASRIELCKDQEIGGTTPLRSTFRALKSSLDIPIYVMIRPHGESFQYSEQDFLQMKSDIRIFREEEADGFVFGVLKDGGKGNVVVDVEQNTILVESAGGKPCTFHRAFDEIEEGNMTEQLDELVRCGFRAVLTSGGKKSAVEGRDVLSNLIKVAGDKIDVIIGGGVRSSNVEILKRETRARVFHSSAIVNSDSGEDASGEEVKLLREHIKI